MKKNGPKALYWLIKMGSCFIKCKKCGWEYFVNCDLINKETNVCVICEEEVDVKCQKKILLKNSCQEAFQ